MQLKCLGDYKLFEAKMFSIANKRPGKPGDILIAFIRRWKVGVTENHLSATHRICRSLTTGHPKIRKIFALHLIDVKPSHIIA